MARLRPGWFVVLFAALLAGSAWLPWLTTSAQGGGRASAIGGTIGSLVLPPRFGAGQLIVLLSSALIVTGAMAARNLSPRLAATAALVISALIGLLTVVVLPPQRQPAGVGRIRPLHRRRRVRWPRWPVRCGRWLPPCSAGRRDEPVRAAGPPGRGALGLAGAVGRQPHSRDCRGRRRRRRRCAVVHQRPVAGHRGGLGEPDDGHAGRRRGRDLRDSAARRRGGGGLVEPVPRRRRQPATRDRSHLVLGLARDAPASTPRPSW